MKKPDKLPIKNKEYNCFDGGIISQNRMYKVLIKEIIPFNKIDKETLELWKNEAKKFYWIYSKETDYFVKGILLSKHDKVIFVRRFDGKWFGFSDNWWNGLLDINGKMTKQINRQNKI